jgi:hypothetical protein
MVTAFLQCGTIERGTLEREFGRYSGVFEERRKRFRGFSVTICIAA